MSEASRARRDFKRKTGVLIPHTVPRRPLSPTEPRKTLEDVILSGYRPWQAAVHEGSHAVADVLLGFPCFCVWIDPADVAGLTGAAEHFRPSVEVKADHADYQGRYDITGADLAASHPFAAAAARLVKNGPLSVAIEDYTPGMRLFDLANALALVAAQVGEVLLVPDQTEGEQHLVDRDFKLTLDNLGRLIYGPGGAHADKPLTPAALKRAWETLAAQASAHLEAPPVLAALRTVAERLMERTVLSGDEVRDILHAHGLEPGGWIITDGDTVLA